MVVEIQTGTPLAEAVQNAVQAKLMELGWSSGGLDDTSLAEYIVLMLVNGQNEEQVATDLSNDILGDLSTEGPGATEFASWLFQQIAELSGQGAVQADGAQQQTLQPENGIPQDPGDESQDGAMHEDTDMNDMPESQQDGSIPTGPRSMRHEKQRDKRMLGHMNRAMDRTNGQVLHKIKGAAGGAGRINSHNREPPKGPSTAPRGPRATMQRVGNANPQRQMQQQMSQMNPNNPMGQQLSHEQQMQLLAMYEQQAKMMAQIFNPGQQQPPQGPGSQPGKSLFDRVDHRTSRSSKFTPNHHPQSQHHSNGDHINPDMPPSMEVEPSSQPPTNGTNTTKPDPTTTTCRFNLTCTVPTCPFLHQSPAAPPGTAIDPTDPCTFGAGCKNRKCTGAHPSPSKLGSITTGAAAECKFFPNCTNASCPFRHPTMPPCRNGADCTVSGCKFYHNAMKCKFDPCLNASCPFKHGVGQKRGSYQDRVWVNPAGEDGMNGMGGLRDAENHVSERKFVDDGMGEELIKPEPGEGQSTGDGMGQGVDDGMQQQVQEQEAANRVKLEAEAVQQEGVVS